MTQVNQNGPSASAEPMEPVQTIMPLADIIETESSVVLLLDVPGADPTTVEVTLDKRVLAVAAKVPPIAPEGYQLTHQEFGDGAYERRFVFSDQMDGDRIEAALKDGVLRVTVPKASEASPKKISVKAA